MTVAYILVVLHLVTPGVATPEPGGIFPDLESCLSAAIVATLTEPETSAVCYPRSFKV